MQTGPMPVEVAEAVVGDVLAGLSITTVCGVPGAVRGSVFGAVANRLRIAGLRVAVLVASTDGGSTAVATTLLDAANVPGSVTQLMDGDAEVSTARLAGLLSDALTRPGMRELVLLVDDADSLSANAYRLVSLLLRMSRDGTAKVRFVLFGSDAPWPELHRVRQNLWATYALPAPDDIPDDIPDDTPGGTPPAVRNVGPSLATSRARRPRRGWLTGTAWGAAGLSLVAACAGMAVLLNHGGVSDARPALFNPSSALPPAAVPPPVSAPVPLPAFPPSVPRSPLDPPPLPEARPLPDHGLMFVVRPGDTLEKLYNKIYQGLPMPPFSEVLAMNPAPVRPGVLVIFPEPPGGWSANPAARQGDRSPRAR